MAGKLRIREKENAADLHAFSPRQGRAFCEGLAYRQGGTLLGRPLADNPYSATGQRQIFQAWNAGWKYADNASPGTMEVTSCAMASWAVVDT